MIISVDGKQAFDILLYQIMTITLGKLGMQHVKEHLQKTYD